jgi:hypothetical protein
LIQTQVVNLYSTLEAMDIATIKQTLLAKLDLGTTIDDFIQKTDIADTKRTLSITAVRKIDPLPNFSLANLGVG